jgi:3-oxoacyl-[acyl-carrier protein] reductase
MLFGSMRADSRNVGGQLSGHGRVVLLTGGSGAMGRPVTETFLGLGYRVASMARSVPRLDMMVRELCEEVDGSPTLIGVSGDVADPKDCQSAASAVVDEWGRIDVLINLAALSDAGANLDEIDVEVAERVTVTNLLGPLWMTRAVVGAMRRQGGGRIINIGSPAAFRAFTTHVVYGATKAGLIRLTKQLAVELGSDGITVNCLSPGQTPTVLTPAAAPPGKEPVVITGAGTNASRIPLGRRGEYEDYVWPIAFLASDGARYINGENIVVDGGGNAVR